jgi:8-oxo-dGTP diphosphatase
MAYEEIKDRELHRIVITAIIYNTDHKYLITKRSEKKKAFPGKWTVPGGGLSIDDYINEPPTHKQDQWYYSVEKALRRELREEVNIEVEKPEYLLDLTFIRPDNIPVLVLSYYAKYISGDVKLDEDSTEFAWVTAEEAKNYDLIDGILEEIVEVDEILKKR